MDIVRSLSWTLQHVLFINLLLAILLVFFERRNPASTWAWLMILVFVPIVGFILYLVFGQDIRKQKMFAVKQETDELQKSVHIQEESINSSRWIFHDLHMEEYQDLIQMHLKNSGSLFSQDNQVQIFTEGQTKFKQLLADLEQAREYIHMEYYIIRDDSLGRAIIHILAEKANQGIEVKLLYDGMGCVRVPKRFFRPIVKAGGQVECFFPPLFPYINMRLNYRNHRKICIIDGRVGYVGGLNVGNEYLGFVKKFGYWRDTHLRLEGSAVDQLQLRFLFDWKFAINKDIGVESKYFPVKASQAGIGIQVVSSGPDSQWSAIKQGFFKMIAQAKEKVYIQTPYFIPDDSIFEALKVAALSGVDVRIMIPNKPDHLFVYWASLSYVGELLKAGVKCYTYQKGFIHSKVILVDGLISTVGTANLDIRSFKLNFEVNAFIYDEKTTQILEEHFIKDLNDCCAITQESYEKRPMMIRMKESVSRLLSPIL